VQQQVDRITCVPGESYLAVLDALCDVNIDVLVCRNEGGAGMMAEAYGKLTGRPGICFVTRGPGSTNASAAVHIASQDSTPFILFVGQVERGMREREAFQELDYRAVFGSMAKWVTEVDSAARIPEVVGRAFRIAMQGRPGPVVIALPEDVLHEVVGVDDVPYVTPVDTVPSEAALTELQNILSRAERPLAIVGGSRWTEEASRAFVSFSEKFDIPVATSFRRAHLFPANHRKSVGDLGFGPNPKLAARVRDADVLLVVGGRMSEVPSQSYSLLRAPLPKQKLIHVHADVNELGRVYQPELAIHATPSAFALAVTNLSPGKDQRWGENTERARAEYLEWSNKPPRQLPGDFQYGEVMCWLRDRLPAGTIVTNGAGNYASWLHRFYRFRRFGTQLAPTCGTMGYGVPAAIMAKRQHPDRTVVAFAGDGDFLMNGQEFATAVQYEIPIVVVVIDNSMYGTIRMHQERRYPGRISATTLRNPDFAGYARVFGGHGEVVEGTEDFAPAFERALASGVPAIIHCKLDPEAILPSTTLADLARSGAQ